MRRRIYLETLSDVKDFVEITGSMQGYAYLEDGNGLKVNAKSMLGALYSLEWGDIVFVSEFDDYRINKFVK